jgi:hypothetical protein
LYKAAVDKDCDAFDILEIPPQLGKRETPNSVRGIDIVCACTYSCSATRLVRILLIFVHEAVKKEGPAWNRCVVESNVSRICERPAERGLPPHERYVACKVAVDLVTQLAGKFSESCEEEHGERCGVRFEIG